MLRYKHTESSINSTCNWISFSPFPQYVFFSSFYPANINLHKPINDIVKKMESESSLLNFLMLGCTSPAVSVFFFNWYSLLCSFEMLFPNLRNSNCCIDMAEYGRHSGGGMYRYYCKEHSKERDLRGILPTVASAFYKKYNLTTLAPKDKDPRCLVILWKMWWLSASLQLNCN